jgi:hypothetical protein
MTEQNSETGQFQTDMTGQAGLERDAGYRQMQDPVRDEQKSELTVNEAAIERAKAEQEVPAVKVQYFDQNDNPMDEKVSVTPEKAARDLTAFRQAFDPAKSISSDFAAAVDKMRAEEIQGDPELEAHYGVKTPKGEAASEPKSETPAASEPAPTGSNSDDAEFERALANPRVADHLIQQHIETEEVRAKYGRAVDAAVQVAELAFLAQFPEFRGAAAAQVPGIAFSIQQQNPQRWQAIQAQVAQTNQLVAAQAAERARMVERSKQEFATYAARQDADFQRAVNWGSPEARKAAEAVGPYVESLGISRNDLASLLENNPVVRHSAFQRVLLDAARYHALRTSPPKAVRPDLPPVQRPGVSAPRAAPGQARLSELTRQFEKATTSTQQIRLAAQMVDARRAARK